LAMAAMLDFEVPSTEVEGYASPRVLGHLKEAIAKMLSVAKEKVALTSVASAEPVADADSAVTTNDSGPMSKMDHHWRLRRHLDEDAPAAMESLRVKYRVLCESQAELHKLIYKEGKLESDKEARKVFATTLSKAMGDHLTAIPTDAIRSYGGSVWQPAVTSSTEPPLEDTANQQGGLLEPVDGEVAGAAGCGRPCAHPGGWQPGWHVRA